MKSLHDEVDMSTNGIFERIKETLSSQRYLAFVQNVKTEEAVMSICQDKEFYNSAGIPYTSLESALIRAAIISIKNA